MKSTIGKLLCVVMVLGALAGLMFGCGGHGILKPPDDGGNGPGPGPADVPLGPMRALQTGDTWNYRCTGVVRPAGGGADIPLTPTNGTWSIEPNTIAIGGVQDALVIAMDWPVGHPNGEYQEAWRIALVQGPGGTMRIHGLTPFSGDPLNPSIGNPPYLEGPDAGNLAGLGQWQDEVDFDPFGDLAMSITGVGVEVIAVAGTTYECYRWNMVYNYGNFPIQIAAWVNPAVGFVRVTFTFDEPPGTTIETLDLQSTSFIP